MTVGVLLIGGTLVVGEPEQLAVAKEEQISEEKLWSDDFRWDTSHPGYGQASSTAYGPTEEEQIVVNPEGVTFLLAPWNDAVEPGVRLADEWQPDLIHLQTHWVWPVARAIQQRLGIPLVYTVHSIDRAEYEVGNEPGLLETGANQEAALAAAERVIALTQNEKDVLTQYYPWARDRVRIVGNGIDDTVAARRAVRKKKREKPLLVLYSGRLVDRKGIAELLAAIPAVLDKMPSTRFVLAGGPPGIAGQELKKHWLSSELDSYWDQIHFTGWLTAHQLAELYCAADILVVPSWYEPFGMVILEGMLYGLPIVAAEVGGPAEILEHGRTGWLFPARDADALGQALLHLMRKPRLRRQLGSMAALEVRGKWLWPKIVRNIKNVYRQAISIRSPARPSRRRKIYTRSR
jgi:glycosyltransferase involved in cell wall biosynthesis